MNIDSWVSGATCPDASWSGTWNGATADTSALPARYSHYCGSPSVGNGDYVTVFTAPSGGTYVFDTFDDPAYPTALTDTALSLWEGGCGETLLDCDDDDGRELRSLITRYMSAGESVTVVGTGFLSNQGTLTMHASLLGTQSCAEASTTAGGCNNAYLQAAVCAQDPHCCYANWDESCNDCFHERTPDGATGCYIASIASCVCNSSLFSYCCNGSSIWAQGCADSALACAN